PNALPMASTRWPTFRAEESARVTVGSPETPLTLSRATSSVGSTPITVAVKRLEWPWMVTEMLVAPAITWLFVRTSPEDVRIMPVPAAPLAPPPARSRLDAYRTVLMSTMAGSTLLAIASLLSTRLDEPAGGTVATGGS